MISGQSCFLGLLQPYLAVFALAKTCAQTQKGIFDKICFCSDPTFQHNGINSIGFSHDELKGNPSEVSQKRTLTYPLFAQALQIFKHYIHFSKVLPDFVS